MAALPWALAAAFDGSGGGVLCGTELGDAVVASPALGAGTSSRSTAGCVASPARAGAAPRLAPGAGAATTGCAGRLMMITAATTQAMAKASAATITVLIRSYCLPGLVFMVPRLSVSDAAGASQRRQI